MNICGLETGEGCPHFKGGTVASYFINGEIYHMRYVCDNEKICKYVIEKMKEKEGEKMNQHEIMDNMTHEEFETINNENASDEEKAKVWDDVSKRIEKSYGADITGTKYVSSIHGDLQELIKMLDAINDNLLCIQDNLCASNIMHNYKQSFDDIQVLLTTVDKDKLHTLANSLKKEDQNYDD